MTLATISLALLTILAAAPAAPPAAPAEGAACPVPLPAARVVAPATPAATPAAAPVLVGPTTRDKIEAVAPSWVQAGIDAKPDLAAAHALQTVPPGAEVTVYLGTWCGDSRREVSRFWRSLDEIGATAEGGASGNLPFTIHYVAVDEAKKEPAAEVAAVGLRYVPIFIVRRDGKEIGRVIEKSPNGIETDLVALLNGKAQGVLTGSPRTNSAP